MTRGSTCKLDRVARRRGLTDIDRRLRQRWADGESLRDLETVFNTAVLRSAMGDAGMEPLDGEAANLYRLLTDDAVNPGERIDAESRLRRAGVDPDAVVDDFVSYGTVRTHLNDCLGMETSRERPVDADEARTTVLKLVSRTETVARRTVERLAARGPLSIGSLSVTLSLRVGCSDCGEEYSFAGLLERGGCACQEQ